MKTRFAYDGLFWRRLARFGAAHGPSWWVRYSPPAIGAILAMALPEKRRAVKENLRRIRGPVGLMRDVVEVTGTFATYAGCLAEGLTSGSKNAAAPDVELRGTANMDDALADKKGVILVTAHTAGWEAVGPALHEHRQVDVVMVMEAERDGGARALHDDARRANGLHVRHVGGDPLASLPLVHELRRGAAIALQIDRMPKGMRGIGVSLFGEREIPEGPLRLAQVSGAPIVPIFCARTGYRRYLAEMGPPLRLPRRPSKELLVSTAQQIADAFVGFVTEHPTQWFNFGP